MLVAPNTASWSPLHVTGGPTAPPASAGLASPAGSVFATTTHAGPSGVRVGDAVHDPSVAKPAPDVRGARPEQGADAQKGAHEATPGMRDAWWADFRRAEDLLNTHDNGMHTYMGYRPSGADRESASQLGIHIGDPFHG